MTHEILEKHKGSENILLLGMERVSIWRENSGKIAEVKDNITDISIDISGFRDRPEDVNTENAVVVVRTFVTKCRHRRRCLGNRTPIKAQSMPS